MIGESLFTGFLVLFWLAEAVFAAVVVYWFVTQGFSESEHGENVVHELEPRSYTNRSLLMWVGFFGILVLLIIVGA
jgi:cytochrome c oxidase assembly factor CtaG